MIKYLFKILRHKYYVLKIGLKFKVSLWRLIKHDWTKFLPCEFFSYYNYYYKNNLGTSTLTIKNSNISLINYDYNKIKYDLAFLHHKNLNDHHFEHYILNNKTIIDMPEEAIKEMIADWFAASIAYKNVYPTKLCWAWWKKNKSRVKENVTDRTWNKILDLTDKYLE